MQSGQVNRESSPGRSSPFMAAGSRPSTRAPCRPARDALLPLRPGRLRGPGAPRASPPRRWTARSPAVPSSRAPVRTTPTARAPCATAAARNSASTAGRRRFSFGPRVERTRPSSSNRWWFGRGTQTRPGRISSPASGLSPPSRARRGPGCGPGRSTHPAGSGRRRTTLLADPDQPHERLHPAGGGPDHYYVPFWHGQTSKARRRFACRATEPKPKRAARLPSRCTPDWNGTLLPVPSLNRRRSHL